MKLCTKCGETKPRTEFHVRNNVPCGLRSWCKTCTSSVNQIWNTENILRIAENGLIWRTSNLTRKKAANSAWSKENPARVTAKAKRHRAAKLNARPSWALHEDILPFYFEAARLTASTGILHTVDHQVPLQSKWVCGLDVPWNLQVVTGSENFAKANRWWPDMFDEIRPRPIRKSSNRHRTPDLALAAE